ncbi:DUF1127 domain-containing protein [Halomonas sp. BL6]|uniref:DUF1127 domain-containing protein n=1 Tax=Halomonas sp. BL6 TaxID=2585770 RepID=UPI001118C538|nr:DUF1127 domain-containing protein [Halomonas sp. BL6]TNH16582.1 DUF1127 domain-containing protein [Halomonas sp. BL6]
MERTLSCEQQSDRQVSEQAKTSRSSTVSSAYQTPWRVRLARWWQLGRERHALERLSDDMLKDIGLSREVAHREANRPFWDDRGWRR